MTAAKRWGFHVDLRHCIGCKACQVACKDRSRLPAGLLWRRVVEITGGGWERRGPVWVDGTFGYFVSTACLHCARPACVEVCPTRAMGQRPDGIVTVDAGRCIGCRYCEWACPYGAPRYDAARGVMTKCDLCADELDAGRLPACVQGCPMRVLEVGDIDELRARHGWLDDPWPLPEAGLTRPATVFTPHRDVERARPAEAVAPPARPGTTLATAPRIGNREEI